MRSDAARSKRKWMPKAKKGRPWLPPQFAVSPTGQRQPWPSARPSSESNWRLHAKLLLAWHFSGTRQVALPFSSFFLSSHHFLFKCSTLCPVRRRRVFVSFVLGAALAAQRAQNEEEKAAATLQAELLRYISSSSTLFLSRAFVPIANRVPCIVLSPR